ncbi:MAG: hypothetical protein QF792_05355, partial [Phycisphaerae bacterium]|nr:hypothetical protein [Phycisphaerae bacterium]
SGCKFTFPVLCELKVTVNLLKTLLPLKTGCLGRCLLCSYNGQQAVVTWKVVNQGFGGIAGFGVYWEPIAGV